MGLRPPPAARDVLCPHARVGVVRASVLVMLTRISSRRSVDAVRSLHHPLPLILPLMQCLLPRYTPPSPPPFYHSFPNYVFFFKTIGYCSARAGENEPLIPAHAELLLTTNAARVRTFVGEASKAADGENESGSQLNTWAYERYFDKPEVIRAYREQQLIQTPEFTLLSEHEAVGGRFRPRSLDDVRAYRAP
jgi:hypothetical protein